MKASPAARGGCLGKLIPSFGPSSLQPTGGRGVGTAPSRGEGVGDGRRLDSSRSGAPVTRPTVCRSPHKSPLARDRGDLWGEPVGRQARWLHGPQRVRALAADVPARLAQRLPARGTRPRLEPRRRRGRRATKRSATQRLARRTSRGDQILYRGPAAGVAGDRGGVLAGAVGQDAKRAAFPRSGKAVEPANPGHGQGPRLLSRRRSRLDAFALRGVQPSTDEAGGARALVRSFTTAS